MSNKTLLITLFLSGLLLSLAADLCFADASTETVRAIAPDPAGLIAHYEFEGYAADTSGFQPPARYVRVFYAVDCNDESLAGPGPIEIRRDPTKDSVWEDEFYPPTE